MIERPRPDRRLRPALSALATRDPDLGRAFQACGLPPVRKRPAGFAGLVHILVAQQISVAAARSILGRLEAAGLLDPHAIAGRRADHLARHGLSRQKAGYLRGIAREVASGRLDLEALAALDDEAVAEALVRLPGIGRWTAEIYLLFALGRPDVWPAGDLALRASLQRVKGLDLRPGEREAAALAEAWRPHRSAAARLLWHAYRHPGLPA